MQRFTPDEIAATIVLVFSKKLSQRIPTGEFHRSHALPR